MRVCEIERGGACTRAARGTETERGRELFSLEGPAQEASLRSGCNTGLVQTQALVLDQVRSELNVEKSGLNRSKRSILKKLNVEKSGLYKSKRRIQVKLAVFRLS